MSRSWAVVIALACACGSKTKEPETSLPPPAPVSVPRSAQTPPANVTVEPSKPESPKVVNVDHTVRGDYVATIAGCVTCHTAPGGARLAGGYEGKLPNGSTWRSPNITMDRDTGIGAWTDEQIIAAMREGVRPDGMHLLPIMPSAYFHRMTDADAQAVVAYLRAQPAVSNRVARSKAGGLVPLDLEAPVGNVDPTDDVRGHGAYLASLMHCGACHTPQTGAYAGHTFAGGMAFTAGADKLVAPNISSDADTGIGRWPIDDVMRVVRTMTKPDGSHIRGPMADYGDAWLTLTDADARALATYVKSVAPVHHDVENEGAVSRR
jgi:mono/diheme cytochrome c family protein